MRNPFWAILHKFIFAVRRINAKYREPRIRLTPWVRFALVGLRAYLFLLIAIMLYKFITLLR